MRVGERLKEWGRERNRVEEGTTSGVLLLILEFSSVKVGLPLSTKYAYYFRVIIGIIIIFLYLLVLMQHNPRCIY